MLGPGTVASGSSQAGAGTTLEADLRDDLAFALSVGVESRWWGMEFRFLVPIRELRVRSESGERFPHHASNPVLWGIGVLGFPVPPMGPGPFRRLRPFLSFGAGGMLVSADLDNTDGATLYHSWQWTLGGGLRFALGAADSRAGLTVAELRLARIRLIATRPFRSAELMALTASFGLRL